jgi:inner membrane protein
MLTNGGAGVMLLFPLSEARLFFPWRPIHVSPLGVLRFFKDAGDILRSEMPFCLGAIAVGLGMLTLEKLRRPQVSTPFRRSAD